jgi:hypothetical protein
MNREPKWEYIEDGDKSIWRDFAFSKAFYEKRMIREMDGLVREYAGGRVIREYREGLVITSEEEELT